MLLRIVRVMGNLICLLRYAAFRQELSFVIYVYDDYSSDLKQYSDTGAYASVLYREYLFWCDFDQIKYIVPLNMLVLFQAYDSPAG